jgi:hypothetical protein
MLSNTRTALWRYGVDSNDVTQGLMFTGNKEFAHSTYESYLNKRSAFELKYRVLVHTYIGLTYLLTYGAEPFLRSH